MEMATINTDDCMLRYHDDKGIRNDGMPVGMTICEMSSPANRVGSRHPGSGIYCFTDFA
jgi:hypothetical protein